MLYNASILSRYLDSDVQNVVISHNEAAVSDARYHVPERSLLRVRKLSPASFRVEIVVPAMLASAISGNLISERPGYVLSCLHLPFVGPVDYVINCNKRWRPVENLLAETAPHVKDSIIASSGEGVLSVRAEPIRYDAPLLHRA